MTLRFATNSDARFSSVVSVDWDHVTGKPDIIEAGDPIVILTSGQSNFESNSPFPAFTWSPNENAHIWDGGREGVTGTSFITLDGTTIILPAKLASDVAAAFPGRPVYLINVVQSGTSITHWIQPTAAPDVFQTILNNVPAALAAIGATKIDLFAWWQGESDTANATYVSNFAALTAQLWARSWFPQETPMLIFGLASTAQSGLANSDLMNNVLQSVANVDRAKRKFVFPSDLVGAVYWQAAPNLHMTPQGYFSAGALASAAYLNGTCRSNFDNTAWTAYTATAVSSTVGGTPATYTLVRASYKQIGKTVIARAAFNVTNQGVGAAGRIKMSLPFTAASDGLYIGTSYEYALTGKGGAAFVTLSGTTMDCQDASATTYIATGNAVAAEVTYEVP